MQWLSKSSEDFTAAVAGHGAGEGLDVLVVGSGYGGAVASLRFAQAGHHVTVLERGEEYVAGDFPNGISQAGSQVRAELASASGVSALGNETALFDFRVGLRAGALVGNGLGGTSLINAGVGLRPDAAVFRQERWPAALRQADLAPFFEQAARELELQEPGKGDAGEAGRKILASAKLAALGQFAEAARRQGVAHEVTFGTVPIAVELRDQPPQALGPRKPCNGCGDCVTGCNHGAKLSLTATYLPRAWQAGASFFTGITVLSLAYEPGHRHPWVVRFIRTAERKLAAEAGPGTRPARAFEGTVRARTVVLSAGTFGSTEILLRSRARGLAVSATALGMQVSGNGDDVSHAYDLPHATRAIGAGADSRHGFVGPTIVGKVELKDRDDFTRDTLVEDGGIPALLAPVRAEMATLQATVSQLVRWSYRRRAADPLAVSRGALDRTLALLGMGHDSAGGTIAFDTRSDRVLWAWPDADKEAVAQRHQQRQCAVEQLGAIFLQNPATSVLPEAVAKVLSGPKPGGSVFTVHPLGGCRMGDNHHAAVVNDWGGVFRRDAEGVFPGLYVLDGSMVPTALGVNPLLTITALAERACELILRHRQHAAPPLRPFAVMPYEPQPWGTQVKAVPATRLTEVLRGTLQVQEGWRPRAPKAQGEAPPRAALFLAMQVHDWAAVLAERDHRVPIAPGTPGAYDAPRLELELNGHTETFEVQAGSHAFLFRPAPALSRGLTRYFALAATYLISRWIPDSLKDQVKRPGRSVWLRFVGRELLQRIVQLVPEPLRPRVGGTTADLGGGLKLLRHAMEVREFEYQLLLRSGKDGGSYRLRARKVIDASAGWPAIASWWWRRKPGQWPPLQRRTVWEQVTQADMELTESASGAVVAHGRLAMDLPDIARHLPSQLGPGADTLTALHALAAYPLFIARVLVKTRLLDFRAPDYAQSQVPCPSDARAAVPQLPDTDPATLTPPANVFELWDPELELPLLHTGTDRRPPDRTYRLRVRLTARDARKIDIGLFRYKPAGGVPATAWDEQRQRTRVKSILLINGFAQNTRAFVAPELGEQALAARLHAEGWDVWMLEYRVSPLLRASALFSSMDDIAAYDIPRAVALVRRTVERQLGLPRGTSQVFAFSHCVGSASLGMSILGGYLASWENGRPVPHLAGVLFSQFHPFLVGSETAQQRLQVGSLLHNVLQQDMLQFTAGTVKADLLHAMLDRLFASAPYRDPRQPAGPGHVHGGERCPGEDNLFDAGSDTTTCKRMTGLLSRLFNHAQLLPQTHQRLDWYFGRTNLGVFLHGARCVEHERLVSESGQNVYVTDLKMGRYLTMPVMLLHGKDNALFNRESLGRTAAQLRRIIGGPPERPGPPAIVSLGLEGFAHFDCTVGRDAPTRVFGPVLDFFGKAWHGGAEALVPQERRQQIVPRCMARVPRTGPIVGWVRQAATGTGWLLRVWFEVSLVGADRALCGLTRLRLRVGGQEQTQVQSWPLRFTDPLREPGDGEPHRPAHWMREASIGFCVADLVVPGDVQGPVRIEALTVHQFRGLRAPPAQETGAGGAKLPNDWGVPLTPQEIERDFCDPPWQRRDDADDTAGIPQPQGTAPAAGGASPTRFATGRDPVANVPFMDHHLVEGVLKGFSFEPELVSGLAADAAMRVHPLQRLPGLVQPQSPALTEAGFELLLATAQAFEGFGDAVARRVEPGTLSRERRKLSAFGRRLAQWTPPAPGPLRFLAAACRHPGVTAAERERADLSLHAAARGCEGARFMLMLGDQIYADARAGLFDSASEIERLVPRYRDAFGSPGFRALASRLPLAMILDDHEIVENWSTEASHIRAGRVRFHNALVAYDAFQRWHGSAEPSNGTADAYFEQDGVSFFLLDTRTGRKRTEPGRVMRLRQWKDLFRALRAAQAAAPDTPKVLCSGSVLAPGLREGKPGLDAAAGDGGLPPRTVDTWQHSDRERRLLLAMLDRLGVRHAVLLSSDYHCSAAADIRLPSGATVVALCAPPLHAPLVFANSQPRDILPDETLVLDEQDGSVASIRTQLREVGDGWLDCRLDRDAGGWKLQAVFHLRDMLGERPDTFVEHCRQWRLGSPVAGCLEGPPDAGQAQPAEADA